VQQTFTIVAEIISLKVAQRHVLEMGKSCWRMETDSDCKGTKEKLSTRINFNDAIQQKDRKSVNDE